MLKDVCARQCLRERDGARVDRQGNGLCRNKSRSKPDRVRRGRTYDNARAGHRIRGRVQNAAGQPIAKARVFYAHGNHYPDGGVGGSATTDSEGRFGFDSLPAKPPFTFDAKGYSEIPETFLPLDGDDEVVVTMQPQGVLRGRLVDAATARHHGFQRADHILARPREAILELH